MQSHAANEAVMDEEVGSAREVDCGAGASAVSVWPFVYMKPLLCHIFDTPCHCLLLCAQAAVCTTVLHNFMIGMLALSVYACFV